MCSFFHTSRKVQTAERPTEHGRDLQLSCLSRLAVFSSAYCTSSGHGLQQPEVGRSLGARMRVYDYWERGREVYREVRVEPDRVDVEEW